METGNQKAVAKRKWADGAYSPLKIMRNYLGFSFLKSQYDGLE
jgi:hypothetical protein